jgi:hypothetical protein
MARHVYLSESEYRKILSAIPERERFRSPSSPYNRNFVLLTLGNTDIVFVSGEEPKRVPSPELVDDDAADFRDATNG